MAETDAGSSSSKRAKNQANGSSESAPPESGSTANPPCGACKFLRRRCSKDCIFAPHFISDQGAALFAGVHKVFGASNVSKLLMQLPVQSRHHAIVTISYEAQARLVNPVYGCVETVLALQKQVAALQREIAIVQNELINNRIAMANTLQGLLQPASASFAPNNNAVDMSGFDPYLPDLVELQNAVPLEASSDQLPFSPPYIVDNDDMNESLDPSVFGDPMLLSEWMP